MGIAVGEIALLRGVERRQPLVQRRFRHRAVDDEGGGFEQHAVEAPLGIAQEGAARRRRAGIGQMRGGEGGAVGDQRMQRSEEPTSELQSLMRTSYAVFCLNKK